MPSADHAAQSSSPDRATGPAGSVPPTPPGVGPLPNPPTAEHRRLNEQQLGKASWCRWGPYLSERQWGTVREDYSPGGEAWTYLTHEAARSRAYRWGEDGLAGISDDNQRLCLSLALWNGRDPILKERPFGLTNSEGNHGEDVKELYYFLDATPTHSYLKMLYKYPQAAYPYERLVEENRRRDLTQPEFELIDTGAFDDGRYFDVFVEYAKFDTKSTLMQITACNRGPAPAELHLLPQLFFRNTWSWEAGAHRPRLSQEAPGLVRAEHEKLGMYLFHLETCDELLFTENDSNPALFGPPQPGFWKDGFHRRVVQGETAAVNSETRGTKAAGWIRRTIPAGGQFVLRAYLDGGNPLPGFKAFDQVLADRRREADEFYAFVQKDMPSDDARAVHRQALAGMIWSKQFYGYEITRWLDGDPAQVPPPEERKHGRNWEWSHFNSASVISMPDTWEYPWFAAWDLAFHCVAMAEIDPAFAKQQLLLLTREWFMHPNGQLPAYEWNFGDVNPPTHAWAAWRVYEIERDVRRRAGAPANEPGDVAFLERVFHKLTLNFTWWVNRKDAAGRNIFQGGFLGMDNVGVFDRSTPLPTGGYINQADGTAWMAMYSLNLMRISLELAQYNRAYEDMATKFFEHFLYIAKAMTNVADAGIGLWDERDQFFYDVLQLPDGQRIPLEYRSMVGLTPLFAVEVLSPEILERLPQFKRHMEWFLNHRPDLAELVSHWDQPGRGETRLLSLLRGHRMKKLLERMLDETEFLAPHGVRSLSKVHEDHPYIFRSADGEHVVRYRPAESDTGLFGGNSNWRGPIWFPVCYLLIESLRRFHGYYGDDFKIECPTHSGKWVTIRQAADEVAARMTQIFLRDARGRRAVFGANERLQNDPHFRDYLQFHEYFSGDDGRGLGAAHQTGWTGLIATLLRPSAAAQPAVAPPGAAAQKEPAP